MTTGVTWTCLSVTARIIAQQKAEFWLATQAKGIDNRAIALDIFGLDVVEQPSAFAYQNQQTPAGVMIFFVDFEMVGQIFNAMCQQTYLNLRRARIGFMQFKLINQFAFFFY
jgi:hypothetical protein